MKYDPVLANVVRNGIEGEDSRCSSYGSERVGPDAVRALAGLSSGTTRS